MRSEDSPWIRFGFYGGDNIYLDSEESGRPLRAETGHSKEHDEVLFILARGTQHCLVFVTW